MTFAGELGAGKTAFIRAALRALGVTGAIKSPTYALVESYPVTDFTVHHIDFYRLEHPLGWRGAGLEACFDDRSVVLIEWADRAQQLPLADIAISIVVNDDASRLLKAAPNSARGESALKAWLR